MNTGRTSVLDRADQLIDANQSFCDGDRSLLIDVDLPVMAGKIFQRLATSYYLNRKTLLCVVLQKLLKPPYILQDLAAHLADSRLGTERRDMGGHSVSGVSNDYGVKL
jgi:hypothetical protein